MKKIFLILFMVLCSGLILTAQSVSTGSADFYADSVSTEIQLSKNEFISSLMVPQGLTTSIKFKVYDETAGGWYYMSDDGSDYSVTVDSSKATFIPLLPTKFYGMKRLKAIIEADIADTSSIYYNKRPY
jgi:hypothetical protein